jgi:MFS family permease
MKARLTYAGLIVAVTFAVLIAAAGVRSAPTMFILPLESEFGWSRATISFAIAVNIALYGLMGPFAAALMVRFGVRRTIGTALVLLAAASALSTAIRAPWQLVLLWGICIGLGVGTISLTLGATIATRWFADRRGTVMGLFAAANATGQLIFLPLFGVIIASAGWRWCSLALAAVCLVLAPFFVLTVREYPPNAPPPSTENPIASAFAALRAGTRSRDFWLLAGTFFICGASTNGLIGTHFVPACGDHGIPETRAAGLLAAMGVFDLIGTTMSGWLSDRWSSNWLLFWYYGLRGASLLFLPMAFGPLMFGLPIFTLFYGLDWIATVPPTLKLTTNVFGTARAAVMFGWIAAGHQVGAALFAFLGGYLRQTLGTYNQSFEFSGLLCLLAAFLVLQIGKRQRSAAVSGT